jgi:hypothetical protein
MVCVTHNSNATRGQKVTTNSIILWSRTHKVRIAVKLDGKFSFRTIEIDNISSDTMLTPEASASYLTIPNLRPQDNLRFRHARP